MERHSWNQYSWKEDWTPNDNSSRWKMCWNRQWMNSTCSTTCEPHWNSSRAMDWAQGTNRTATKIPGPHAPRLFSLGSEVTSTPVQVPLTTLKIISVLLLQTSHLRLQKVCNAVCSINLCEQQRINLNIRFISTFPSEIELTRHPKLQVLTLISLHFVHIIFYVFHIGSIHWLVCVPCDMWTEWLYISWINFILQIFSTHCYTVAVNFTEIISF
jgi:hypothetical protein